MPSTAGRGTLQRMTGRGAERNPRRLASSARPHSRRRRTGLVGLLCTLAVLAATLVHHAEASEHHRPVAAIAAASQSGQSITARTDLHAVAVQSQPAVQLAKFSATRAEAEAFTSSAVIEIVRTRGPPVPA